MEICDQVIDIFMPIDSNIEMILALQADLVLNWSDLQADIAPISLTAGS